MVPAVRGPLLSGERAGQVVPRVELHARLIGPDLHGEARPVGSDAGGGSHPPAGVAQDEIVVVSPGISGLRMTIPRTGRGKGIHLRGDGPGFPEVEGRPGDRPDFPRGNQMAVDGRIGVGEQRDLVVQHRAGLVAGKVPVGVVGQVHHRGPVAPRFHRNPQLVVSGKGVGNRRFHPAGIPFLSLFARVRQYDEASLAVLSVVPRFPDLLVESAGPTVDVIGTGLVVDRQVVVPAFQRKPSAGNPVGAAAHGGAEERMSAQVFVERIESEHDVHEIPAGVRDFHGLEYGSVIRNARGRAARAVQRV